MRNLYEPLPVSVTVSGRHYPINTSFRVWLQAEKIMQQGDISQAQRVGLLLQACCKDPAKCCTVEHVDALLRFYRCGRDPEADPGPSGRIVYDFEQDADYIYAAFMQAYGIDLTRTDLHWWQFRALFASLPESCVISRIMGYRAADLKDMSKGQKKFYQRMKKVYALKPADTGRRKLTLEERDQLWLDQVNAAYAQAETKKEVDNG